MKNPKEVLHHRPTRASAGALQLQVEVDYRSSGFCFGVVYAIKMAEDVLDREHELYCLGDIVHNDEEVRRLKKKGLRIISHGDLGGLRGKKVLIRAHGEPPSTYKTAHENDITLIDSSCPVVLKLQDSVGASHHEQRAIYIYGQRGHPEVVALLGQTDGHAVVFERVEELNIDAMPKKITLFSQTTKSVHSFHQIAEWLRKNGIEVVLRDTICRQVSNRDKELENFAKRFEKVLFVTGTKSSNGKVLYQTCLSVNPNTYCVSSEREVRYRWFRPRDKVGICGATSTPMWLMERIKSKLSAF